MSSTFHTIQAEPIPSWMVDKAVLIEHSQRFYNLYKYLRPTYHIELLNGLSRLWPNDVKQALDLGAGDGLVGSAIQAFFPIQKVTGLDINLRVHPQSSINIARYNGQSIDYPDKAFDVTLLINVIHHVPKEKRLVFIKEVKRVTRKVILIKDHLATNAYSRLILRLMDLVGNAPFGGMVEASYLSSHDWQTLFVHNNLQWRGFSNLCMQQGPRSVLFRDDYEIMIRADV